MSYTAHSPTWSTSDRPPSTDAAIDLFVTFDDDAAGEVEYHATADDTDPVGLDIFTRAAAGEFGTIADEPAPPPADDPTVMMADGLVQVSIDEATGITWLDMVRQTAGTDRSCRLAVKDAAGTLLQAIKFPTDLLSMVFQSKAGSGGSFYNQATLDTAVGDFNTRATGGVNYTDWIKARTLPVGAYVPWSGDTGHIPPGYIQANGAVLSRTSYADLYSFALAEGFVVEATWSAGKQGRYSNGDLSTTFRIPDLRGTSIISRSGTSPDWGERTADDVKSATGATYRSTTAITWLIKAYTVA